MIGIVLIPSCSTTLEFSFPLHIEQILLIKQQTFPFQVKGQGYAIKHCGYECNFIYIHISINRRVMYIIFNKSNSFTET